MNLVSFFVFLLFAFIVWFCVLYVFSRKNNLPVKDLFSLFFARFPFGWGVCILVAGFVSIAVAVGANELLTGLYCALVLLLFLPVIRVLSAISNGLKAGRMMKEGLFSKLVDVDYFHVSENGIALSVRRSKICLAIYESDEKIHFKNFSIESVRNVKAVQEGHEEVKVYGGKAPLSAGIDDLKSCLESNEKTGLFLYLDDIVFSVVCIPMPFDAAQKWLVLMERFLSGNLESRSTPFTLNT
ncbi:MAG: hypothetical protein Q4A11_01590 [Brachymonas sp.]|nr:hypothetical protein [Brachymonas sp.]